MAPGLTTADTIALGRGSARACIDHRREQGWCWQQPGPRGGATAEQGDSGGIAQSCRRASTPQNPRNPRSIKISFETGKSSALLNINVINIQSSEMPELGITCRSVLRKSPEFQFSGSQSGPQLRTGTGITTKNQESNK
jgi:hypothetical protein